MPTTHRLKTWPVYYDAIERGDKTFEIRKNDRAYQAGDTVELERYEPDGRDQMLNRAMYPSPTQTFRIGWILHGGQFGLKEGYCAFSLMPVSEPAE